MQTLCFRQLRICSKKKVSCLDGDGTNTGWSWLERWMATRQPEFTFTEEYSQKKLVRKRILDVAMEEKESCGSNDVSSFSETGNSSVPKNIPRPNKNRVKIKRSFSRQDSAASSHLCPKESKVQTLAKFLVILTLSSYLLIIIVFYFSRM